MFLLLYHQIDGVSMGSVLAPVITNIFMSAFETSVVNKIILTNKDILPFYIRYVSSIWGEDSNTYDITIEQTKNSG